MSEEKDIVTKANKTDQPVTLTDNAAAEFKKLLQESNVPEDHGVRIGVKGGGCAGFSYILGFDSRKEGDLEFEVKGLRFFMNKSHGLYLAGMEIDYMNGLNNRGFTFNNPNADNTCGCGSSFG